MSHFDVLLVGHLIGDFLFQTNWMASCKVQKRTALLMHATLYTLIVSVFAHVFGRGLSVLGILLVYISHVILDQKVFVKWWVTTVMRTTGEQYDWLHIMVDQIFHIVILIIALYI